MKPFHRIGGPAVPLALAAATLLLVPTLATAAPSSEGREVVSVTPLEDAATADRLAEEALIVPDGLRRVDEDGSVVRLGDADFTSDASTRSASGEVSALAERPSRFDLRDATFRGKSSSFVTPVKRQNPFGACWTFGSLAAAESSVLTEYGLPYQETVTAERPKGLDLSEKQLCWFTWIPIPEDNPMGQGGEGFHTIYDPTVETHTSALYGMGGFFHDATTLFSSITGPLDESVDPILEYHNATGDYDTFDGFAEPSPMGDWSVPEAYRDQANFELEETFSLPSPASFEPTDDPDVQRYVFNQAGVDAIRDQLLAGRAVGIGFCADQSQPGDTVPGGFLNTRTWAQYTYQSPYEDPALHNRANHAVCIVGYDDDYPVDNFNAEYPPPGPGAFIVKNSWGALDAGYGNQNDWGIDGSGYFYLSYYDKSIEEVVAYDFVTPYDDDLTYGTDTEPYEVEQYQYAYLPGDPTAETLDGVTSMANVYTVEEPSLIRDVSTQTYGYDTDVRFDVYLLDDGATEPTDGTLSWSRDEHFEFGGYHRVEVDEPLPVPAGSRVSVVCTVKLPDGRYELAANTYDSLLGATINIPVEERRDWGETVVSEGESFLGSPSRRVEYGDGSYAYDGYAWADLSQALAANKAKGQAAVDAADIDGLLEAREKAYEEYQAHRYADEDVYTEYRNAYLRARDALDDAVTTLPAEASAILTVQDNYPINMTTEAYDPENPPVAGTVELFRLYNPISGEHLYTSDANEREVLKGLGWADEGTGWTAPARSNTQVWRLFNPSSGEHLYTADANERATLAASGWADEGLAFHSDGARATPVYRLYNPAGPAVSSHHFTTDANERDVLVGLGWRNEGVAWYGA